MKKCTFGGLKGQSLNTGGFSTQAVLKGRLGLPGED